MVSFSCDPVQTWPGLTGNFELSVWLNSTRESTLRIWKMVIKHCDFWFKKKKKICLRITRWLFPWSMHWLIPRWKVLSIHGRIILWNINQFSFLPTSFLFPISFFQARLFYTHYLKKQWHRWSLECFSGFWVSKVLSSSEKNLKTLYTLQNS